MGIIKVMTVEEFKDAFATYFGGQYKDNFSQRGLELLFNHLNDMELTQEFDLIAIACSYTESNEYTEDSLDEAGVWYHPTTGGNYLFECF